MTVPGRTETTGTEDLLGAIGVLTDHPTPRGHERFTAYAVARWAGQRWPGLSFVVDEIGPAGANLVCSTSVPSRHDLLVYSHLDTSLTGFGSQDREVTGSWEDARTGFSLRGDIVSAFGLGVARGPAAAALVGFAGAATSLPSHSKRPLRLVLAGGGTHENSIPEDGAVAESTYSGLRTHLATYPMPGAAIVAKGGPPGILWEEPGAGYLRIRVSGERGAVLARDGLQPQGGLPTHVGQMCAAVESWRSRLKLSATRGGQTGREAGIGAIRTGSIRKPDLLPAFVDLYVYVVTAPGDVLADLADDLVVSIRADFAKGPLRSCVVAVELSTPQAAGMTPADCGLVNSARAVWERHHGRPAPDVVGWTGSTDGALLREAGVDTVRTGPASVTDNDDAALDALSVTELVRFAHIYAEIGASWAVGESR
jgi:hypothetical protein